MKKALFVGNCQNSGVLHYLNYNECFRNTYEVIRYNNYELIQNRSELPKHDLENADLFVYQPVNSIHGKYSTDPNQQGTMLNYLPDYVQTISYPYIYNSALWPLCQARLNANEWFGWESIYKLLVLGANENDIIELYRQNKIDWNYQKRYNLTNEILKSKEDLCDIKIMNFITEQLTKQLLFLMPQHPTSVVFAYLANCILKFLNLEPIEISANEPINIVNLPDSTYNRSDNLFPIHKSAIDHYGFDFAEKYIKDSEVFYENLIKNYIHQNESNQHGSFEKYYTEQ